MVVESSINGWRSWPCTAGCGLDAIPMRADSGVGTGVPLTQTCAAALAAWAAAIATASTRRVPDKMRMRVASGVETGVPRTQTCAAALAAWAAAIATGSTIRGPDKRRKRAAAGVGTGVPLTQICADTSEA